tara:strand:- start:264 stop:455 length:192 start_codon:yes stop_codon:yes gene_type:complete
MLSHSPSSTVKNPATTWVVTNRTTGMSFPNWDGPSRAFVLHEASDQLNQPITNLAVQLQKDWS